MKQCILIGAQGSGKTTLFNKICQQQQLTSSNTDSCTKIITTSQSKGAFKVIDTPGISFINDIFQHSITIFAALTNGPINKILLIVEYEKRLDKIEYMVTKILRPVKKYIHLIGVIVTHFDECKQQDIQQFQLKVTNMCRTKYSINQVIFSGLPTTGDEITSIIEDTLVQNGQILQISDDDFDEMMLEHQFNKILEDGKQKIKSQFTQFRDTVKKFLSEFYETVDQDQILHSLLVFVRQEQTRFQESFEKEYGPIMEDLHQKSEDPILAYYYYYVVKYQIKQMVSELTREINQRMKYPEDHPFRQLRRCPRCDTIWLKVIGCSSITCGERLNWMDEKDLIEKQKIYPSYKFYYVDTKKIAFNKNHQNIDHEMEIRSKQLIQLKKYYFFIDLVFRDKLYGRYGDQRMESIYKQISSRLKSFFISQKEEDQMFESLHKEKNSQSKLTKVNQKAQTTIPFGRKLKQLLLEAKQQIQIKENGYIGCGLKFDWDTAPLVNIDDIDLDQKEIMSLISNNETTYKSEQQIFKNEQIQKALVQQKNL